MAQAVLVVDDEPDIRGTIRRILERAGLEVTEAINGSEALQLIRRGGFDLVTMDMEMAQMDGVDAISVLRSETDVPIVVISAHLTDAVVADLRARGVVHFIKKPFAIRELMAVVNKALDLG